LSKGWLALSGGQKSEYRTTGNRVEIVNEMFAYLKSSVSLHRTLIFRIMSSSAVKLNGLTGIKFFEPRNSIEINVQTGYYIRKARLGEILSGLFCLLFATDHRTKDRLKIVSNRVAIPQPTQLLYQLKTWRETDTERWAHKGIIVRAIDSVC